jgi:hypothetical protein
MPQASDYLRKQMRKMFGNIGVGGPSRFLEERGFTLTPLWNWTKPGETDFYQLSLDEQSCIVFLMDEWDYGGFQSAPPVEVKG